MKKVILFLAFAVLALALALVSCGNGTTSGIGGGTFTIIDIPSQYNGKYARFGSTNYINSGSSSTFNLTGCENENMRAILISNGRVSIPVWKVPITTGLANYIRYSGNDTATIFVRITNSSAPADFDDVASNTYYSVTFLNGSATRSW